MTGAQQDAEALFIIFKIGVCRQAGYQSLALPLHVSGGVTQGLAHGGTLVNALQCPFNVTGLPLAFNGQLQCIAAWQAVALTLGRIFAVSAQCHSRRR